MQYIRKVLLSVREEEQKNDLAPQRVVESSRNLANNLLKRLEELKSYVLDRGFISEEEEIEFFKKIKPEIQGKLIFYNKVFRVETACPAGMWELRKEYFRRELRKIEQLYEECTRNCPFFRYYYLGNTDLDSDLFIRGRIDINHGLCSYIFDSDRRFSTYYDYKIARIISDELFYDYLINRINSGQNFNVPKGGFPNLLWDESKNALIELIYALFVSKSINNENANIKKVAMIFSSMFNIELIDIHHAFHRMKNRTQNRTAFLDYLKKSLEEYMDKDFDDY